MFFFFQAEDGIRDRLVTGVQTCALPIFDDLGEEEHKNLFLNNSSRYRENIIRTSYTWNVAAGQGLELGFEAARTIQDTDLKLGLPVSGQASPQFGDLVPVDRKSTRLNSSHKPISYAVFCLKKKKTK